MLYSYKKYNRYTQIKQDTKTLNDLLASFRQFDIIYCAIKSFMTCYILFVGIIPREIIDYKIILFQLTKCYADLIFPLFNILLHLSYHRNFKIFAYNVESRNKTCVLNVDSQLNLHFFKDAKYDENISNILEIMTI